MSSTKNEKRYYMQNSTKCSFYSKSFFLIYDTIIVFKTRLICSTEFACEGCSTVVCVILCSSMNTFNVLFTNLMPLSIKINLGAPHHEIIRFSSASQIFTPVAAFKVRHSIHFVNKSCMTNKYWNPGFIPRQWSNIGGNHCPRPVGNTASHKI